mgnify:CR=1 FL=1
MNVPIPCQRASLPREVFGRAVVCLEGLPQHRWTTTVQHRKAARRAPRPAQPSRRSRISGMRDAHAIREPQPVPSRGAREPEHTGDSHFRGMSGIRAWSRTACAPRGQGGTPRGDRARPGRPRARDPGTNGAGPDSPRPEPRLRVVAVPHQRPRHTPSGCLPVVVQQQNQKTL